MGAIVLLVAPLGAPVTADPARASRPADPNPQEESSAELKAEYDEVIGQEADLLRSLAEVQSRREAASAKLDELRRQTADKQFELLAAQDRLQAAQALVTKTAASRRRAVARTAKARERLRAQVVASFVAGGDASEVGSALLRATSGDELGTALAFGNAIVGNTDQAVAELEKAEAAQTRADRAARAARAEAQTSRDEIGAATAFLSSARDRQAQLVVDVNFEVLAEADALRKVQGRKAVVEGSINAMNRASDGVAMILAARQANQPDWVPGSVVVSSPLPGAPVVSPYGMRHHPILGITRLHAGCDLDADTGDEVHAAADGVVVLAEVRGGYGNAVVIDHGNSLGTLYGHNSRLLVKAGEVVKRGDVIALAGSTGLSTGPHVHFETRVKGLPIDPEGVVDFDAPVDYRQGN